ncbi:hypothetical protein LTR01_007160 [Friedmanniomyces endolithicus]|nr:hypothetical protein LTR01_007160 [Friedmanniomyces endolithicus]KAK0832951.1 hypothetical protein LTR73_002038 [Friedmanniomyces endolithicus]
MAFLRRSKSHKTKHPEPANPTPPPQLPRRDTQPLSHQQAPPAPEDNVAEPTWKQERRTSRLERRGSIFGRSKSASDARSTGQSVERPRTAGTSGVSPPPAPTPTKTTKAAAPAPTTRSAAATGGGGRSRGLPSHLSVIGETIEIKAGGDTFNFPTPSPRLPSSTTQQGKGPSTTGLRQASSSLREPSSQSEEPLRLPPTPGIGRAIGSPSQAPPTWGSSYTADEMNGRMMMGRAAAKTGHGQNGIQEDTAAETATLPRIPELRRKESRWKTLGGLFARKHPRAPSAAVSESFYKVQLPPPPPQHSPSPYAFRPSMDMPGSLSPGMVRSPGSISTHHSRTPSINRGLARAEARAEADRQSFMPGVERMIGGHVKRRSVGTPLSPIAGGLAEDARTSVDLFGTAQRSGPGVDVGTTTGDVGGPDGRAMPRMPRLDLDIPGAEMERYSVMFEKLLEPRQSILERRQSKAKRQKSVVGGRVARKELPAVPTATEEICGPSPVEVQMAAAAMMGPVQSRGLPQRSLTSPHLKRVPSLTVTLGSKTSAANLRPPSSSQPEQMAETALHRPRPIRRSKTAPTGSVSPVAPYFSRPKPSNAAASTEDLRTNTPESPLLGEESLPPTPTNIMALPSKLDTPHETLSVAKRRAASRCNDSVDEQSWDMLTSLPSSTPKASPRFPQAQQQQRPGEPQQQQAPYPHIKSPADLERQIVQVSVARQVSVSKARKLVQRAQVESRLPLRPRVVEMKGRGERKSTHVVLIEGGED